MRAQHILMAITMVVVVGFGWVFGKSALSHFPPIFLLALRFAMAAALLVWWTAKPVASHWQISKIAFFAISLPYALCYMGVERLDMSTTALLTQIEAPSAIIVGAIVLKEYPTKVQWIGIVIAILGALFLAGAPGSTADPLGVGLFVLSYVIWAYAMTMLRRASITAAMGGLGWFSVHTVWQSALMSLLFERGQWQSIATAGAAEWAQVLYIGVIMTILGTGIWYTLIARYPAAYIAPFLPVIPIVTVIGGVLLLDEKPTSLIYATGAVILTGVVIATVGGRLMRLFRKAAPALPVTSAPASVAIPD